MVVDIIRHQYTYISHMAVTVHTMQPQWVKQVELDVVVYHQEEPFPGEQSLVVDSVTLVDLWVQVDTDHQHHK
jgi:hypothetical protein